MATLMVGIAIAASGCKGCRDRDRPPTLPGSHGAAFDVIVVANHSAWDGVLGDSVRSVMRAPVPMINSYEPQFYLIRSTPQAHSVHLRRHRNTIVLDISPEHAEPRMVTENNRFAAPQIIVYVQGPNQAALARYVGEHGHYLRQIFAIAERDRFLALAHRSPAVQLQTLVQEKFGFEMSIPQGFTLANNLDNFLWLRQEYPQSSQGIVIYTYPHSGPEDFTLEALMARRNGFVGLIPGEVAGSYMTTYPDLGPEISSFGIRGRQWIEMRGFWDVHGDFMGGPFVSYTTLDAPRNRIVTLDFYVYSPDPKKPKRNLLRQLESKVHGVRFIED